ncbi:MAG: hypothetical protein P9F19_08510 [Candidatus Contendobacter sp.]|nr:hypothetical protein [Candidatus Contendobacter sp.]MDG4557414.1 hypothetical protein [Candidatus Contendobacter sp.]
MAAVAQPTAPEPAMRFEDLPLNDRHATATAASRFLARHRYVSLDEACQTLDLTLAQLWSRIMEEAGLPDCDPPTFTPFV